MGHVVHYVSHGTPMREDGTQAYPKACRAATVTEVSVVDETLGLCVLSPTGFFFHSLADGGAAHDEEGKAGGTWHWPERVGT